MHNIRGLNLTRFARSLDQPGEDWHYLSCEDLGFEVPPGATELIWLIVRKVGKLKFPFPESLGSI